MCQKHYDRVRKHGDPHHEYQGTPAERHARKVDKRGEDECWPWLAARDADGYGTLQVGHRPHRAHRIAYEAATGQSIPAGLVVRHTCDNPPCQNPRHLLLGTHADNAQDKMERGRHVTANPHQLGDFRRRLTEEQVAEIRARATGAYGEKARLGREYGVSDEHIRRILNGSRR